jgi:hypothetical protein
MSLFVTVIDDRNAISIRRCTRLAHPYLPYSSEPEFYRIVSNRTRFVNDFIRTLYPFMAFDKGLPPLPRKPFETAPFRAHIRH